MTGSIKVDTAKLRSTAGSFQNTGNTIRSMTNQMVTLVNSLTGNVWSGDAATAYTKRFSELKSDIDKMVKMVTEHVNDLNAMAREYEAAETENKTAAETLAGNILS